MRIITDKLAHRVCECGATLRNCRALVGLTTADAQSLLVTFNNVDRVSAMEENVEGEGM